MPYPRLPSIRPGKNQEEAIQFLTDAYNRLRKEISFLLMGNLDDDNILSIDAAKIKNLKAEVIVTELLFADYIQSGTAVTQVLYAEEGRIARLTVNHLLTGDFITGTDYIYFIDAQDQYLKFIIGTRRDDLDRVHYTDADGQLLYWDSAAHNYMTPLETEWPVMVYVYDLMTKLQMDFERDDSGTMVPKVILGAGAGVPGFPEYGKGYIYKETDGLLLRYIKTDGTYLDIKLGENGISIPNNLESIDFYDNGFSATYDGNAVSYTWTKDAEGKITSLTTEDSVVIPVTWNAGDM